MIAIGNIKDALMPYLTTEEGLYKLLFVLLFFLACLLCIGTFSWMISGIKKYMRRHKKKPDNK